ncbi:MAG: RNA methyltransferase [Candidatus Bathyarchaeota archaeon]|nr:RNA methyltransferase [Candidatus Bathyarchaeota archaeon]MDH5419189.1 RNA methyltransferase [Candidatus Bathyarchaeota archaeon]MDH5623628.1 RNA methyltransferase [Candidatus Bathyarchaeota archaeon]MDH5636554.1 RNA methyltransferase [Candidatus Bathyarchaeota archaeon]MDH5702204.1 RNA methyltransferase [Candidatus Bathyarchaeota archaeon]
MMQNRDYELSIAIPASLVSDVPHLREKTTKISLVGRAAAIFCVNEIIVFPDFPDANQRRDIDLVATILAYMETPQYLRKRLFKIKPELRYAGILPPLRTPHHPLANRTKDLTVGEYREGAVLSLTEDGSLVDIGVERPVLIPNTKLPLNTRVTVKVTNLGKHSKATLANSDEIKAYWGYRVTVSNVPFGQLVKSRSFDLMVATSRYGTPLMKVAEELTKRWKKSRNILVAFGAPTQGLYDIVARENLKLNEVAHFTVNTIPNQGTETVRTEEALYTSLAILNLIIGK